MSALPPPPPSSKPPGPAPAPAPAPTPPAPPPEEPTALMPYDDLFGGEERPPEAAPNLTFSIASAPPPPASPRPASGAKPAPPVGVPGVVVGDDRPAFIPPLPVDEPPDPLLASPIAPVPVAKPTFAAPPPPKARPKSMSELMQTVGKKEEEDTRPPEPQMWSAADAASGKAPDAPKTPVVAPPTYAPRADAPRAKSISQLLESVPP